MDKNLIKQLGIHNVILGLKLGHLTSKTPKVKLPNPEKKCVNCKQPHTVARPFCSADCCREYKANGNVARVQS